MYSDIDPRELAQEEQVVAENQRAQITMSDDEVRAFLVESRTATMATVGPNGVPHLIAMWYGLVDGKIYFETKAKSQKPQNMRLDPTIVCMVEAGLGSDHLHCLTVQGKRR